MGFLGDLAGFLAALADIVGWPGLLLAVGFVVLLYLTRKRPGRRYDEPAPGRADAEIDSWGHEA